MPEPRPLRAPSRFGADVRDAGRSLARHPLHTAALAALGAGSIALLAPLLIGVAAGLQGGGGWDAVPGADLGGPGAAGRSAQAVQHAGLGVLLRSAGGAAWLALATAAAAAVVLLLARGLARRNEVVVRAAVGASPGAMRRRFLLEIAVPLVVAIAIGVPAARAVLPWLDASWPGETAPWTVLTLRGGIVVALLAVWFSILVPTALVPVRAASRIDLYAVLAAGARATADAREAWLRSALAVGAVAASFALLTSSGLLLRGFRPEPPPAAGEWDARDTLTLRVRATAPELRQPASRARAWERLVGAAAGVPGVRSAALISPGAWAGLGLEANATVVCGRCFIGSNMRPITRKPARHQAISAGALRLLGVPVVRGREFDAGDRIGAPPVALISRSFANAFFPGADPLGRRVELDHPRHEWYTVVGVVEDVQPRGIGNGATPMPAVYLSAAQVPPTEMLIAVRVDADPHSTAAPLLTTLQRTPGGAWFGDVQTLDERLVGLRAPLGWFSRVLVGCALAATLLSAGGLAAAMALLVRRRTREIAVRMALGAGTSQVVRLVVAASARVVALGLGAGLVIAVCLGRMLQFYLRGVPLWDAPVYLGSAALLAAAALAASAVPALRASRIPPAVALSGA